MSLYVTNAVHSVGDAKRTLMHQAEEGAKLETLNKDLSFKIAQVQESHTYVSGMTYCFSFCVTRTYTNGTTFQRSILINAV